VISQEIPQKIFLSLYVRPMFCRLIMLGCAP
jgi:hypothetical protein